MIETMQETVQFTTVDHYQRMFEISRDLASTLNLDTLLDRIVLAAADLCDAQAASILLYDEAANQLRFEATTNLDEPVRRGLVVPVDKSIAGWIVTNRRPLIVNDVHDDPRHCNQVAQKTHVQTHSLLGVPLIAKNKMVGVLEAINKRLGSFDEQDQSTMTTLAAQAAVAIENARLFQQSDMIAELAHEFRAPLSMILTAAQLFQRPKITEEQRAQMAEMIIKEAQRLSELTTAHLELARMESGRVQFHFEEVRLQAVLAEELIMMSSKAQEKGIELFLNVPDDLPSLEADPNRLKQVVINLLSNAIKYTPPQGWVKLSAWATPGEVIFTVADTGVGIPAESLPKIFEKFFRVPESKKMAEGNGLGLSICQRIIEAHGGRIDVDSDEGVGTTFTVTLPLNR